MTFSLPSYLGKGMSISLTIDRPIKAAQKSKIGKRFVLELFLLKNEKLLTNIKDKDIMIISSDYTESD